MDETRTDGVRHCDRCGGDHERLEWKRFAYNDIDGFQYWALCPTNGDPVLLRVEPVETSESLTAIARQRFAETTGTG